MSGEVGMFSEKQRSNILIDHPLEKKLLYFVTLKYLVEHQVDQTSEGADKILTVY